MPEIVIYDKNTAQSLSGGFGTARVIKITEVSSQKKFVLKYGSLQQNINAVLVSQFLKKTLDKLMIKVQGKYFQFYTPSVTIAQDVNGRVVQKQEFLDNLDPNINNKKIQGLASLDNLIDSAKLGVVYQFLMLGDNISHNNRVSPNGKFNIFDFDNAIKLGGKCIIDSKSIFRDEVSSVGHALNNHFIDILELRFKKDKYNYIDFNNAAINELENETWEDFLFGCKDGLELIKANITEEFVLQQWGNDIPPGSEKYLQEIREIINQRLANIDKNIAYLNDVLSGAIKIPEVDIKQSIKEVLAKQANVTDYLKRISNLIADEMFKPAPKIISIKEAHMSQLRPVLFEVGPSKRPLSPGRLFKFDQPFSEVGINFETNIDIICNSLAVLTSTKVDEQGIHHPCSCNGPPHAFIVAKFSYMVAGEMLAHKQMGAKINSIIGSLSEEAQEFLTKDNYYNYKKLIEIIALLHDTGRPSDGIDEWDATNELNVVHNIEYLLKTTRLSADAINQILIEVKLGISNKDNLDLKIDTGFLFGAPVGAGDSLHSGHAFHGGVWDFRPYNPDYVRVYRQYPSFQHCFRAIIAEVRAFVPAPTAKNGGCLAAVKNYLSWSEHNGDGKSIIKLDFTNIIHNELSTLDPMEFPIMAKHFEPQQSLIESAQVSLPTVIDILESHNEQFTISLDELNIKISELEMNVINNLKEYKDIAKKMRELHTTITEYKSVFFLNPTIDNFNNLKLSLDQIDLVDKSAKKHRGWHTVHPILRALVGILAVISVIPALIVAKKSKHGFAQTFFAKPETDTKQKLSVFNQIVKNQINEIEMLPENQKKIVTSSGSV